MRARHQGMQAAVGRLKAAHRGAAAGRDGRLARPRRIHPSQGGGAGFCCCCHWPCCRWLLLGIAVSSVSGPAVAPPPPPAAARCCLPLLLLLLLLPGRGGWLGPLLRTRCRRRLVCRICSSARCAVPCFQALASRSTGRRRQQHAQQCRHLACRRVAAASQQLLKQLNLPGVCCCCCQPRHLTQQARGLGCNQGCRRCPVLVLCSEGAGAAGRVCF